jgi:hypothetical protein
MIVGAVNDSFISSLTNGLRMVVGRTPFRIVVYHDRRIRRMIAGAVNDSFISSFPDGLKMVMGSAGFRSIGTEPSCLRCQQPGNCETAPSRDVLQAHRGRLRSDPNVTVPRRHQQDR